MCLTSVEISSRSGPFCVWALPIDPADPPKGEGLPNENDMGDRVQGLRRSGTAG